MGKRLVWISGCSGVFCWIAELGVDYLFISGIGAAYICGLNLKARQMIPPSVQSVFCLEALWWATWVLGFWIVLLSMLHVIFTGKWLGFYFLVMSLLFALSPFVPPLLFMIFLVITYMTMGDCSLDEERNCSEPLIFLGSPVESIWRVSKVFQ